MNAKAKKKLLQAQKLIAEALAAETGNAAPGKVAGKKKKITKAEANVWDEKGFEGSKG